MEGAISNFTALYQTSHFTSITHLVPKIHIKNPLQMTCDRGRVGNGGNVVGTSQFVEGSQGHQEKQRNSQQPEADDRGQHRTGNKGGWGHGAAVLGRIAQNKVPDSVVIDLMKDFTYYRELTRTLPYSDLTVVRQLLLTTCHSHGKRDPEQGLSCGTCLRDMTNKQSSEFPQIAHSSSQYLKFGLHCYNQKHQILL